MRNRLAYVLPLEEESLSEDGEKNRRDFGNR